VLRGLEACGSKWRRGECVGDRYTAPLYDDWKDAFWASWNSMIKCNIGPDDDGDGINNYCDQCPGLYDPENQCGFEDLASHELADFQASIGAAWVDHDRDGDLDLFLRSIDLSKTPPLVENKLFDNGGGWGCSACHPNATGGVFGDIAGGVLRSAGGHSTPPVWADYDNDGLPDLFAGLGGNGKSLLKNLGGGTFNDVSTSLPIPDGMNLSIRGIWVDYNNDGILDLYVVQGYSKQNKIFRGTGSGFVDATADVPDAVGFVSWVDYDNDGDMDFCGDNSLYRNDGGRGFTDVSASVFSDSPDFPCLGVWGDYNNDGYLDLFVTGVVSIGRRHYPNIILKNMSGNGFRAVTEIINYASGPRPVGRTFKHATWLDFDNDGLLDLYGVDNNFGNMLFRNLGGDKFSDATSNLVGVNAYGVQSIAGDFDGDGRNDIYLVNTKDIGLFHPPDDPKNSGRNYLFRNIIDNGNHWLEIDLKGTVSNASGIGTHVTVIQKFNTNTWIPSIPWRRTQLREISGAGGDARRAHFGLGDNAGDVTVEVRWPSGALQVIENVAVDQRIEIVEEVPLEPVPGDLDGNRVVDGADYAMFRSTLGKCNGDSGFLVTADYDNDGCVTYADYRIWYGYYRSG